MGLDYTELEALLNDEALKKNKNYQQSGKEYVKRLCKIFESADIPDPKFAAILADVKRYSEIDVVATSSLSGTGTGTISEERKLFNKIVEGFNKYADYLQANGIMPDTKYTDNGKVKSYKDAHVIMSNLMGYFESLQTGYLKDDYNEIAKLKKDPNAKVDAYFINAVGQSYESAFFLDHEHDITDVPLFTHDPSPSDIRQYAIGDCYLLAGLSELALRDPQAIKDSMRDNKDGTVTVRFWQRIENTEDINGKDSYKPVYVTVDKKTPHFSSSQDCCWTQIMERAYVASGLHMCKGMDYKYNKPMPHNIGELYQKYKNMDPEERPTHQECPWLFDEAGNLHKPKLSYKSIEGGHSGPFLAAFLGEKFAYTDIKPRDYISQAVKYGQVSKHLIKMFGAEVGVEVPDEYNNIERQNILAKIEQKMLYGKDYNCDFMFKQNGELDPTKEFVPNSPFGSTLSGLIGISYDSIDESEVDFATLKTNISELLASNKVFFCNDNNAKSKMAFEKLSTALLGKVEEVKALCMGKELTGNYTDSAKSFYNQIDELTRVKNYLVTAGTYGENDKNSKEGIYDGHAYSVLGVKEQEVNGVTLKFVEVRNPHGQTGRKYVGGPDGTIKREVDNNCKDGVFLVELDDFLKEYSNVHYNSPVVDNSHIPQKDVITPQTASKINRIAKNFEKEVKATDNYFSKDSDEYTNFRKQILKFESLSGSAAGYPYDAYDEPVYNLVVAAQEYKKHLIRQCYPDYFEMGVKPTEPKMEELSSRQKERLRLAESVITFGKAVRVDKSRDPRADMMDKVKSRFADAVVNKMGNNPKFAALIEKYENPETREDVVDEITSTSPCKELFKNIGYSNLAQLNTIPMDKIVPTLNKTLDVLNKSKQPAKETAPVQKQQKNDIIKAL